jgi:hypothetical protein
MNKRYIVGITCGSENGVQVAPYFVVGIDHDQATRILEWMDKFELGGALHDAAFVEFWDSACVFLDGSCAGVISDEQLDELLDGRVNEKRLVLNKEQLTRDPDTLYSEDDGFVRTEGDLEVIWTGHACFRGWISGTDDLIETTPFPRALIEQIARETAPTNQIGEAS